MTNKELIKKIEEAVKRSIINNDIAHQFDHIDRVRKWIIKIGKKEKIKANDLLLAEIVALCHDFDKFSKGDHGLNSAKKTILLLEQLSFGTSADKKIIFEAIRDHNKLNNIKDNKISILLKDADRLDGFGVFGLIRAYQTFPAFPYYNKNKLTRKKIIKPNDVKNFLDEIYYQINWYGMLRSKVAKYFAKSHYDLMLEFVNNFKQQVNDLKL